MKVHLLISLFAISLFGFSQSTPIFGIYQLDTDPTLIYLELRSDSTFHFITHYDFNGAKDYSPELEEKAEWRLVYDSTLELDEQFLRKKKATFKIVSNNLIIESRKKDKYFWNKVTNYDSIGRAIDYSPYYSKDERTIHYLIHGKQLISTEDYKDNSLVKRVTYFELSEQEINSMIPTKSLLTADPIEQVMFRVYLLDFQLPVKTEELWSRNKYKVTHFNKEGEKIKVK